MPSFSAAAIQMTSTARVVSNLTKAKNLIESAVAENAKLVGLPENFSFMGKEEEKRNMVDQIAEETHAFLVEMARQYSIYLLGGGYPTPGENGKYRNTAILIDPQGIEIFRYHKIHLFDQEVGDGVSYRESKNTEKGKELPSVVHTELGNLSSAICYDVRFPELFRGLSSHGCEICFLPAAFTVPTGIAHWEVLLRARAIENLMYVIAPAQVGVHDPHGNRKTYGHAMIVSPWGEILAQKKEGEGYALAALDLDFVRSKRKEFPALSHRTL